MGVEAKERNIYKKPDFIQTGIRNLEENPPCNTEDNLRAGLVVIEAWFRDSLSCDLKALRQT